MNIKNNWWKWLLVIQLLLLSTLVFSQRKLDSIEIYDRDQKEKVVITLKNRGINKKLLDSLDKARGKGCYYVKYFYRKGESINIEKEGIL